MRKFVDLSPIQSMGIVKASTSTTEAHLHGRIAFHVERLVVIGGLLGLLRIHPVVA